VRGALTLSYWSRRKKFQLFMHMMTPTAATRVLDVGVADSGFGEGHWPTENFLEEWYPWPGQITAVGTHGFSRFRAAFPQVTCVTGDGTALPFPDDSFDIAFSNAVIEHVGTQCDQEAFAREICRVSRRIFVTTPNRLFPLELHTKRLFVHWFPAGWKHLQDFGVRLLTPYGFKKLFPMPVRIINLGATLIAVNSDYG